MSPVTPDEWLPVLSQELDSRQPRIALLRSYTNGHAPLPQGAKNSKPAWQRFQKKARTDLGGLAISACAERIVANGITVAGSADSEFAKRAERIWRDNRMVVQLATLVTDVLTTSIGYLIDGRDDNGNAVISAESPEYVYAATDPLQPWKAVSAIKVWRDRWDGNDYCYVWADSVRVLYFRKSVGTGTEPIAVASGEWTPVENGVEPYTGSVPVYVVDNVNNRGDFESQLDLLDRIHLNILHRLVITAIQAFRQRALRKEANSADISDDDDLAAMFTPDAGAMWELPEGWSIQELQATDFTPLLEGEKADIRQYATEMRVPLASLIPDGQNQSAKGADLAGSGLTFRAQHRIDRIRTPLNVAMVRALEIEGVTLGDDTLEVLFERPEQVSISEKYAAAAQAKAAGLARHTIMRDVLGMGPDEIAQDDVDLANEQLQALLTTADASSNA